MYPSRFKAYGFTLFTLSQALLSPTYAQLNMYVGGDFVVNVIDATSQQVTSGITGFQGVRALAWDQRTGIYVADISANTVFVIDTTNNTVYEIPGSFSGPAALALNGGTGMYVANVYDNSLSIIDTTRRAVSMTHTFQTSYPPGLAFDGVTGMYLTNPNTTTIDVIDVNSPFISHSISLNNPPFAIAWDGATGMYVAHPSVSSVSVINTITSQRTDTIPVLGYPISLAWDGATGMYVATVSDEAVSVIDTLTLKPRQIATPDFRPNQLAWDGLNSIYVTNPNSANASVIDTHTCEVVNTIPIGKYMFAMARGQTQLPPSPQPQSQPILVFFNTEDIADLSFSLPNGDPVAIFDDKGYPNLSLTTPLTISANEIGSAEVTLSPLKMTTTPGLTGSITIAPSMGSNMQPIYIHLSQMRD